VLLSHFVTSPDCICGMAAPLPGCAERSSPKAALRRAGGAGLDGERAARAIIVVAATYKGHSALFEALRLLLWGLSFHRHKWFHSLKIGTT
jgi:hypothetical protein